MWARFDDTFTTHPKLTQAGPLLGWVQHKAIEYGAKNLTDGYVPQAEALAMCVATAAAAGCD